VSAIYAWLQKVVANVSCHKAEENESAFCNSVEGFLNGA
jgi:hypothetical protein